jgi:hypothetical protein
LEKIEEHLSESGPSKVLEVLKNQHHKLRKAERFEDYMPKGEERIQLERALDTIEMYKALLVAMSNGPVGLGRPFAVNQQMRRWLEKNNIKSDRKYEVVDQSAIELIKMDLDLIEQQIKGYLKLGERAYTGKKEEDIRIKKQFSQLILKYINDNASAFTIDDFSLLPPDKDKTRFKEPEELVAFYAHAIYQNFH